MVLLLYCIRLPRAAVTCRECRDGLSGDWARVPLMGGRVRPSPSPRARCGRRFALMYASRRRRGSARGAHRRQGTGPCGSTRQNWGRNGERQRGEPTVAWSRATAAARRAESRWRSTEPTSCQRWKRTGSIPSHPSASPLNPRCVSVSKERQLGRRRYGSCRLKNSCVPASGPAGAALDRPAACSSSLDVSQVADCGRLRGASIHRAK